MLFSVALMSGVLFPALTNAGSGQDFASRLGVLEFQSQGLNNSIQQLSEGLTPPSMVGVQPDIRIAQTRGNASTNLRISQMEEQMRILNGQVEGLQFQLTQIQMLIERMQEDNEFRFQQLEGGGSGKTEAAIQSGGDMPAGELSQNQILSAPVDTDVNENTASENAMEGENLAGTDNGTDPSFLEVASPNGVEAENEVESDGFGERLFGESELRSTQLPTQNDFAAQGLGGGQGLILDLDYDPASLATKGDADAQYRAGFEAVMDGDYQFAQDQFRQFVDLFPDHPQAPDATNWLGESLIINEEYDEAAQVLFSGFEKYQNTTRAPDLLFKLGVALAGAGEAETACRTFDEVLKRYPSMGGAFLSEVRREAQELQC
ncbi:MAG: tol-pal system protein YbgF [Devosiaceae bacterium]|nr:tol-pal system protein YbgF [Devosiaceae bacterium]